MHIAMRRRLAITILCPLVVGVFVIVYSPPDARPESKLEHGMGFEPMNNGFAGRRVSHFAIRARMKTLFRPVAPKTQNPPLGGSGFDETKNV